MSRIAKAELLYDELPSIDDRARAAIADVTARRRQRAGRRLFGSPSPSPSSGPSRRSRPDGAGRYGVAVAIEVRPATRADDGALARIDGLTWSSAVSPAPPPEPGSTFFGEDDRRDDTDGVLVAELDGHLAGYVRMHQFFPVPSHAHVLEVNGMAVDPAYQRRGVARTLLAEARREAGRRGARKLSLRVLGPNDGARRLYEACGFVVEGVLVGEFELDGVEADDVLMAVRVD